MAPPSADGLKAQQGSQALNPNSSSPNAEGLTVTEKDLAAAKLVDGYVQIRPRAKVSILAIDETELKVLGLQVGLQDYLNAQTPVVSFFMPKSADYIQLLRCRADVNIRGRFDNLEGVEIGAVDAKDETRIYKANDFWQAAVDQNGCLQIADSYSDKETFQDAWALNGSYKYVARACVDLERIAGAEDLDVVRNCSRQVALSGVINFQGNTRQEAERDAMRAAQGLREEVDRLGRQLYLTTLRLNNALAFCEQERAQAEAEKIRKNAITSLLGFGVTLGAELISPGVVVGENYTTRVSSVWARRKSITGASANIAGALQDLFASPSDYPRTCTEAVKEATNGEVLTQEIKAAHEDYAAKYDQAARAREDREQIEDAGDQ